MVGRRVYLSSRWGPLIVRYAPRFPLYSRFAHSRGSYSQSAKACILPTLSRSAINGVPRLAVTASALSLVYYSPLTRLFHLYFWEVERAPEIEMKRRGNNDHGTKRVEKEDEE